MKKRKVLSKISILVFLFVFSANGTAGVLPCSSDNHLHQDKIISSASMPQSTSIETNKAALSKSKSKNNTRHLGMFKLLIPNSLR